MGDKDGFGAPGADRDVAVLTESKQKLQKPPMFKVLLHNDDFTTMEFVVFILKTVFNKGPQEAQAIMMQVHQQGVGIAGVYTHEIAERGRSLSSGQRQLIALARAELVDPAILLLDEATSNLDLASEHRVTAAMQQLSRHRTTIVIAHRLQTARAADRIAVLDRGRVVEVGGHQELLDAGGRYAAMWEAFELVGHPGALATDKG